MFHLIAHILGIDDAAGRWYLWWSGAGADLGIIGAIVALYRRHTCEIARCPRLARHLTAARHRLCRRHHPDGPLTVDAAHTAHHQANRP